MYCLHSFRDISSYIFLTVLIKTVNSQLIKTLPFWIIWSHSHLLAILLIGLEKKPRCATCWKKCIVFVSYSIALRCFIFGGKTLQFARIGGHSYFNTIRLEYSICSSSSWHTERSFFKYPVSFIPIHTMVYTVCRPTFPLFGNFISFHQFSFVIVSLNYISIDWTLWWYLLGYYKPTTAIFYCSQLLSD